jgi:AcrR family transcriptional regulator
MKQTNVCLFQIVSMPYREVTMRPTSVTGGETTRAAIIEAAFQLFVEQGYHGTSVRDIAARAGITAGSIYNHFPDKEQIIKAVVLKYHPIVRVLPLLSKVEGATAEALIRDAASRLAHEIQATPGILQLVFIELVEMGGRQIPELALSILPEVQRFMDRIYGTGDIERPSDPLTFFRAFVGMLMGFGVSRLFLETIQEPVDDEQSLNEYIQVFLQGVLKHQVV